MTAQTDYVAKHNARLTDAVRAAKDAGHDYVACQLVGGGVVHAAHRAVKTRDGYRHPRPDCQAHTRGSTAAYAHTLDDQTAEVTCKRCLAR